MRDHCVLDCFPIERLHLRVKGEADPVCNTRTFEKSVLAGVVIQHTLLLEKGLRGGLRGNECALPGAAGVRVADKMDCNGLEITTSDFVAHLPDEWLAQVICCLCDDSGDLFAVLQPMEVVEQIGDGSFRCRCGGPRVVSEAVALEQTAAWYWVGEEVVVVRR